MSSDAPVTSDVQPADLSPAEVDATFALVDADGDGAVTKDELVHVIEALGGHVEPEQAEHALEVLDQDGDGVVSPEELRAFLAEGGSDAGGSPAAGSGSPAGQDVNRP